MQKEAIQYFTRRVMAIIIVLLICALTFTNMDNIADLFTNDDEVTRDHLSPWYGVFFAAITPSVPITRYSKSYKDVK